MNARTAAALAALALLLAAAPSGAATWRPVTSGKQGNSNVLGLARTADGVLHVAWNVDNPDNTESLNLTNIAPNGTISAPSPIVSGWAGVGSPGLAVDVPGVLRVFFGGSRTTNQGEDLFGMITAQSSTGGQSWELFLNTDDRTQDFGYGRVPGVTFTSSDVALTTWYDVSQTVVHFGTDRGDPVHVFADGTGGACCAILQNIAYEAASDTAIVAWCQFDNAPDGVFAQGVDPHSGAPSGPALLMPGSQTTYQGQPIHSCEVTQRQPLAVRAGGGIYTTATAGYPSTPRVLVWRIGDATSATVANSKGQSLKVPQLAADPNGRLWVGWIDQQGRVTVRRSNTTATIWGAPVVVKPPKGTVSGFALDLSAQAGVADVIARFGSVSDLQAFHTQVLPGLTLAAAPASIGRAGAKVTFRVSDAGDPVKGATVKVAGKSATTSAKGTARIALGPFRRKAKLDAAATKPGYVAGNTKVRVK